MNSIGYEYNTENVLLLLDQKLNFVSLGNCLLFWGPYFWPALKQQKLGKYN